ncbi:MAG: hypothetical protein LBF12_00065 [Christensenellaceae bacterium]|jgi:hypothetical protein|nr:hypothetical protein [Christensenellaceae bacterium]
MFNIRDKVVERTEEELKRIYNYEFGCSFALMTKAYFSPNVLRYDEAARWDYIRTVFKYSHFLINSQEEWDNINYEHLVGQRCKVIQIDCKEPIEINAHVRFISFLEIVNDSNVTLNVSYNCAILDRARLLKRNGHDKVYALDDSTLILHEGSAHLYDRSKAYGYNKVLFYAYDNSHAELYQYSSAILYENATAKKQDRSKNHKIKGKTTDFDYNTYYDRIYKTMWSRENKVDFKAAPAYVYPEDKPGPKFDENDLFARS